MEKALYTIISNELIADKTYRMRLAGPTGSLKRAGQFVNVAVDGFFLRRPLAAQEWDPESLAVIYKVVGQGTEVMSGMQPGQGLELLCGLGNGFDACGPAPMMKAVCTSLKGPGEASLEERMGCGCGICYGCTCHTNSGAKRVCADGPVFKKEYIIW